MSFGLFSDDKQTRCHIVCACTVASARATPFFLVWDVLEHASLVQLQPHSFLVIRIMTCLYSMPNLTYIYVSDSLGSNCAALTPASIHIDSLGGRGSLLLRLHKKDHFVYCQEQPTRIIPSLSLSEPPSPGFTPSVSGTMSMAQAQQSKPWNQGACIITGAVSSTIRFHPKGQKAYKRDDDTSNAQCVIWGREIWATNTSREEERAKREC